jgi:shikimate kinase
MHVFLIGYMGAGKSTWGARLAGEAGAGFVDLDREVEERAGRSIAEIFHRDGESAFRVLEREVLGRIAAGGVSAVIACGGGTPCDSENRSTMRRSGRTLWLAPSFEVIWGRLSSVSEREKRRPILEAMALGHERAGPVAGRRDRVRRHFDQRTACYESADRCWAMPDESTFASEVSWVWTALAAPQPTR